MKIRSIYIDIVIKAFFFVLFILVFAGFMTLLQDIYKSRKPTYAYEIWVNGTHYYTNEYIVDQQGKLTFTAEDGYVLEFYQPNNLTVAQKKASPNVK